MEGDIASLRLLFAYAQHANLANGMWDSLVRNHLVSNGRIPRLQHFWSQQLTDAFPEGFSNSACEVKHGSLNVESPRASTAVAAQSESSFATLLIGVRSAPQWLAAIRGDCYEPFSNGSFLRRRKD